MQNWSKSTAATRQLSFLIHDQFSNHGLANLMEPFRAANTLLGRQAYIWRILTPDDGQVTSSSGLPVGPTAQLADVEGGDILFVIASYNHKALVQPGSLARIRRLSRQHQRTASIDTGSWLLAAAGLLDGRRATIHYDLLDGFAEAFPRVDVERARWVEDGPCLTCGGALAGFDLACDLIGRDHGAALVLKIGQMFMSETASRPRSGGRLGGDRRVDRALAQMAAHIEHPLAIPDIARQAGCRQRDLEQRFIKAFGASPAKVYRRLRLDAGKQFLEQGDMRVGEVALRCGYEDASAFARAFRAEFGVAPKAMQGRGAGDQISG